MVVCAARLLLCSALLCLSDVSDLGLSVSISSTLLVLVSLPLVRSWPVLSSPVQSTWQSSAILSSRLIWFGLFLSKPPHLPSLTFFHSPSKQGLEGVCSTVQHRTQSILQARHLLTEFSHCAHLPLSASIRRAATFPESILVPEASFWRQQQYVSIRTSLLRPSPQPFKLYIESLPGSPRHRVPQKPQRRTARFRGFRSTSAGLD